MNRLRIAREQTDMTLLQVGKALKVTPMTIQRFEAGTRNVSLKWLERLAKLYNVRVATLVDEDVSVSAPANFDAQLFEEIIAYALERCKGVNVDSKTLTRVIGITYSRCQQERKKPKTAQIHEKIDDMLSLAAEAR